MALTSPQHRFTLGAKFILLTCSLVLVTAFVIGLYVIKNEQRDNYELLLDHGRTLAVMIAQNSGTAISREDRTSLRHITDIISTDPSIAYVFILNAEERVLIYKTADDFPVHIPAMPRLSDLTIKQNILHRPFYNEEDGKHYVNIMAPVISRKSALIGYVHVGISQEGVKKRVRSFIFSIVIFTSLIITAGIMVTVLVARRIIAPINDLSRATQEIAAGNPHPQINIHTNDEVSDLARAFNHMLLQLQASNEKVARHTADLTFALDRMRLEIAEREKTEKALKESEKKFRTIFEESKDVIFICSHNGKFLDINRAGAELFAFPSVDVLRSLDPPVDLYDDPEQHRVLQQMLQQQGFVKDHEIRMKRSDGEKLTVLVTAARVRDEPGSEWTYRGVFHDVTDKRRLEQQLVQSQKMEAIGQLAGGIAHDFNNILTAIMGYANLLLMDIPEENPVKYHAEHILSSSERAANLTRSLLAFSRKQVITPKPVNLNDIVTAIDKLIVRLIGEDVELRTQFESDDIMILADNGQIEQVLINLCTNARDAMPKGGVVTITISTIIIRDSFPDHEVERPGAYAVICVSDTGFGMEDRVREKIFEPFFTTKETGRGTGLGLSIVYGIIKQHNGYIAVHSQLHKGTSFTIYLPLIEKITGSVERINMAPPQGGSETILVAEDDEEVRRLIKMVLIANGYRVIEAVDGQHALAMISSTEATIDLLLLDVIMPKKNGKEVYDTIKKVYPDIKAIFMSGYTADIIDKKGIIAENLSFLSKPIAPRELLNTVRDILDR